MSDKVSIKGLSASLDSCLDKIERVGVSLEGLSKYASLLEEVDSLVSEILSKKQDLDSMSLSPKVKEDLSSRLDGLALSVQRGGETQQQFSGINRIGSLSGGLTFSPAFQSRVSEASRGMKSSGMGGAALKSQVLQDLRRLGMGGDSKSSSAHGGMNGFMSMRITQMGDALMGVGAFSSGGSSGSLELQRDKNEELLDETVDIIRQTSDEILDALGSRSTVKGNVSSKSTASKVDIKTTPKEKGFSWGSLLKTLGTVGVIGGAAFGALSNKDVQDWLVKVSDPKERKKMWDDFEARVKPMWEDVKSVVSKIWGVVSDLGSYLLGVSSSKVSALGELYNESYEKAPAEVQQFIDADLAQRQTTPVVKVEGVDKNFMERATQIGKTGLQVAIAGVGSYVITKTMLSQLYKGGLLKAAIGTGGVIASGVGAVVYLMEKAGESLNATERETFNVLSAQAALEAGLFTFRAYVPGTNTTHEVALYDVDAGEGVKLGGTLSLEAQRGLSMGEWAMRGQSVQQQQVEATVGQLVMSLRESPYYVGDLSRWGEAGSDDRARAELVRDLVKTGSGLLKNKASVSELLGFIERVKSEGMVDASTLRYAYGYDSDFDKYTVMSSYAREGLSSSPLFMSKMYGLDPKLAAVLGITDADLLRDGERTQVKDIAEKERRGITLREDGLSAVVGWYVSGFIDNLARVFGLHPDLRGTLLYNTANVVEGAPMIVGSLGNQSVPSPLLPTSSDSNVSLPYDTRSWLNRGAVVLEDRKKFQEMYEYFQQLKRPQSDSRSEQSSALQVNHISNSSTTVTSAPQGHGIQ